ncbi:hypothetical protein [Dolichospermum circinale]|uniref:hypothetical protein n=1 Tax=Dolichospermum circinale TaxID=109265 RepID=UPI00232C3354|nr:hypothetical protein [Dolichospermum circinale]
MYPSFKISSKDKDCYYQLPITNYLLPITNYQLPITYYLLPITYYRLWHTILELTNIQPRQVKNSILCQHFY